MTITFDPTNLKVIVEIARFGLALAGIAMLVAAQRFKPWWTFRIAVAGLVLLYGVGVVPTLLDQVASLQLAKIEKPAPRPAKK